MKSLKLIVEILQGNLQLLAATMDFNLAAKAGPSQCENIFTTCIKRFLEQFPHF